MNRTERDSKSTELMRLKELADEHERKSDPDLLRFRDVDSALAYMRSVCRDYGIE